jgi:predicted ABC-type transport system involved in lysophospholipase L1 biosynthesis ATPase subunit
LENVLIPTLPRGGKLEAQSRAQKLLERVGLGDRIHHRPAQLSGGECQRTAVVRALINSPGLLLADEPTGSLDQKTSETLIKLLIDLNKEENVTLIMVTHSQELAARMQKKYQIKEGILK